MINLLKKVVAFGLLMGMLFSCQKEVMKIRVQTDSPYLYNPDSVTVTWDIPEAEEVSIEGIDEPLPQSGSKTLYFDKNVSYKIVAKQKKQSTYRNISVPIRDFKLQISGDTLIREDSDGKISWKADYATRVVIDGVGEFSGSQGSAKIKPDTVTTYFFTAYTETGHSVSSTYTVYIDYKEGFSGDRYCYDNEKPKLIWRFVGVENVKIVSEAGEVYDNLPSEGSLRGKIFTKATKKRNYQITATYPNGKVVKQDFDVFLAEPHISVQCRPTLVEKGQAVKVTWQSRFVTHLQIDGVSYDLPNRGFTFINPLRSQKYTLRGKDKFGKEVTEEFLVQVRQRKFIKGLVKKEEIGSQKLVFDVVETNREDYPNKITLKVVVVDTLGNFVSGLADTPELVQKYFMKMTEQVGNGNPSVRNFQVKEVNELLSKPYAINLTLDYSGSMTNEIDEVEKATHKSIELKHPKDLMSIVKFDDRVSVVSLPSVDEAQISKAYGYKGLSDFGGGTALYAGADKGLNTIIGEKGNFNLMQVVLTDGWENSSFEHFGVLAHRASMVVKKARENNIRIMVVALGDGTNAVLLQSMANLTDGYAYFVDSGEDVGKVYNELWRLFRNYYEISFEPIKQEGSHIVKLTYNNNIGQDTAERIYQVGENYNIDKYDVEENPTKVPITTFTNKTPVAAPQSIANFAFNQAQIEQQYKNGLNNFVNYLKANPNAVVEIYGHTDMVGEEGEQMTLSERRAEAVKQYFISQGIASDRIATKGFGKSRPLWYPENTEWQARENRRIEVLLLE